jgi:DNA-3-methyladenine glycosylase I
VTGEVTDDPGAAGGTTIGRVNAGGAAAGGADDGAVEGGAEGGVLAGPDGLLRCPWALSAPEYVVYHDTEWGRPIRDTVGLFERISLEAFQSGLSWLTILRKREAFRAAFAGFDPEAVARFGPADVERLLTDAGIVRNRRKIEATVRNARAVLALERPLGDLIWSHRPEPAPPPGRLADLPAVSAESAALAKALKKAGFVFLGPTTVYALMQACGLVDDHLAGCHARGAAGGNDSLPNPRPDAG